MTKNFPASRVLLKLSGEIFGSENPFEFSRIDSLIEQMTQIYRQGIETGVVMGAGNIIRGAALVQKGIPRQTGDTMGMLATLINALALSELLNAKNVKNRIITTQPVEGIGESYHRYRCREYLEQGEMLLFAGGTGHPYFTTDTAAALRAVEIGATCLLKGTKVDGVYSGENISQAKKFDRLSYRQVLENRYRVMDLTAVAFCMDNQLPIRVFNLMEPGNLLRAANGETIGTLIS